MELINDMYGVGRDTFVSFVLKGTEAVLLFRKSSLQLLLNCIQHVEQCSC